MKKFLVAILSIVLCLASLTFLACDSSSDTEVPGEEPVKVFNDGGFKEGYALKYSINDEVILADLVDNKGSSYTLVAKQEGATDDVLTNKTTWKPAKIGTWVLELNIASGEKAGEYSIEVLVKAPNITLEYTENEIRLRTGVITFEELIEKLKITSNFEDYGTVTKRIYSIRVVDETNAAPIKFSATDVSYEITTAGSYDVIFGVEAEDGQFYKGIKRIRVQ